MPKKIVTKNKGSSNIVVIISTVVVLVVFAFFMFRGYQNSEEEITPTPTPTPTPTLLPEAPESNSVGGQLFNDVDNIPQTNPYEDIYENPFE